MGVFDIGLFAHYTEVVFIVGGGLGRSIVHREPTTMAVGIVIICLMRAGMNLVLDDLEASDFHLRLSAR
jgi:hypothetical protein